MRKKVIALVTALAVIVSMIPVFGYAETGDNAEGLDVKIAKSAFDLEGIFSLGADNTAQKISYDSVSSMYIGGVHSLNVSQIEGNGALSYDSSNEEVAAVSEDGKITALSAGTAIITINVAAVEDEYDEIVEEIPINVSKLPQEISCKEVAEMYIGESVSLEAETSGEGSLEYSSDNEEAVSVSEDGTITAVGAGEAVISITASETEIYAGEIKEITVTVSKISQEITCEAVPDMYVGDTFELAAKTSGDSALEYASLDEKVASADEAGIITATGAGETVITITAPETDTYIEQTKEVAVNVSKKSQEVTFEDVSFMYVGYTFDLEAKTTGDSVLRYESDNEDVATVDKNGTITATGEGTVTISIFADATDRYEYADARVEISIEKEIIQQEQTIECKDMEVFVGDEFIPDASAMTDLSFVSGNEDVIGVNEDGTLTALKAGTATIAITAIETKEYAKAIDEITVTVNKKMPEISCVEVSEMYVGDEADLKASATEDVELSITSSDEDVASVSEGKVTAVGKGTATITITSEETDVYEEASKEFSITVSKKSQEVSSEDVSFMYVGKTFELKAETTGDGSLNYNSSDETVAAVSEDGVIKAIGEGKTVITITAAETAKYIERSKEIELTVAEKKEQNITCDPKTVTYGDTFTLEAVSESGNVVACAPADDKVVKNEDGSLTAVKAGEAVIALTAEGNDEFKPGESSVVVTVNKKDQEITCTPEPVIYGDTFTLEAVSESGNVVACAPADDKVVKNEDGSLTAVKAGEAVITLTVEGNEEFKPGESSVVVTVNKKNQEITCNPEPVTYGDTFTLEAVAESGNVVTYTPSDDNVVINEDGSLTAVKAGEAVITLTVEGNENYNPAEKTVTITVEKKIQDISYKEISKVTEGEVFDLEAVSESGNVVTCASSNDNLVKNEDGTFTAVKAGEVTIILTAEGNDEYMPARKEAVVTVEKKIIEKKEQNIKCDPKTVTCGDTFTLDAASESGNVVTCAPTDDKVVKNEDGTLTAVKAGEAVIALTAAGNDEFKAGESSVVVTVNKKNQEITYTRVSRLTEGETFDLNANAQTDSVITSDNESAVAVKDGSLIAIGAGTAKITISAAETEEYYRDSVSFEVTVEKKIIIQQNQKITNSDGGEIADISLKAGSTKTLNAKARTALTYKSSNEKIATVSKDGKITAVGVTDSGKTSNYATITITAAETEEYAQAVEKVKVTVSRASQSISYSSKTKMYYGTTYYITAKAKTKPTIKSSSTSVLYPSTIVSSEIVDGQYVVKQKFIVKKVGTAKITISAGKNSKYNAATSKSFTVTTALKAPTLKATALTGHKIKITWSQVPGASGYKLYLYNSSTKKYKLILTKSSSIKSVTHKGLKKGKTYKYKVRAYRNQKSGSKTIKKYSAYSSVASVKAK